MRFLCRRDATPRSNYPRRRQAPLTRLDTFGARPLVSEKINTPTPKMSIYATLWMLKFPRQGYAVPGCDWVRVSAQGVPPHIGSPTPGLGYEDGDPYGAFLPPPLETDAHGEHEVMRAVVFVTPETRKGTERSPQEYADPLLVLTGEDYAACSFGELHRRLCGALRDNGS